MIRLLLDNYEVDAVNELDILLNYKFEDVNNPTVVKNMFSKTVSIPSTKNNDKIFGYIYKLDRVQEYSDTHNTGIYFNPSKRVSFTLLDNTNIIETGYFQLDKIEYKSNTYYYNITLYGGLGNFLYSIMYDEDGEKIKLSDLKWDTFFNEENTQITTPGDEFGFTVNAFNVYNALNYFPKGDISNWTNAKKLEEGLDIYDWITFMPSYNGYYDDFDSDKVLVYVNTDNSEDVFSYGNYTSFSVEDVTYRLYPTSKGANDGYAKAELSKELTEWEMRELRSYKQRPALRLRRLIETICKPENNGGYTVNLDSKFFNDNNPYWNDTYIAMPLLNSLIEKGDSIEKSTRLMHYNVIQGQQGFITTYYNGTLGDNVKYVIPNGGDFSPVNVYEWDLSGYPYTSAFNMHYAFNLRCYRTDSVYRLSNKKNRSSILLQIIGVDTETDRVIYNSKIYNFTDNVYPYNFSDINKKVNYSFYGEDGVDIYGRFVNGVFKEDGSDNLLFDLVLSDIPIVNRNIKFKILFSKKYNSNLTNDKLFNGSNDIVNVGWINPVLTNSCYAVLKYEENDSMNSINLTKDKILSGEETPADYLLSFVKAFGLNLTYDNTRKEISILTKNSYFIDEIEDINECIDYSNEYNIKPLTFDKKWFNMSFDTEDTKYSELYKNKYDVDYGCKRINTNYNFNSEENKLLDGNTFKNGITVLDKSDAYYNWMDNGEYRPNMNVNYYEYKLFDTSNPSNINEKGFYVYPYNQSYKTSNTCIGKSFGFDATPKICYYDESMSLTDFSNCLVIRNGLKSLKDGNSNWIWYSITDDIPEMYILNGNPCYLYAYPNTEIFNYDRNSPIQWTCTLPIFTKYKTSIIKDYNYGDEYSNDNSTVSHSLDFGSPREMYCNWSNSDDTNLYYKFWGNFIEDQNDVNTRIVECYVLFKHKIDASALRKFYFFNNSYWILNEVTDYNVSYSKPTKCKFIKVNNIDNYTNGQKI